MSGIKGLLAMLDLDDSEGLVFCLFARFVSVGRALVAFRLVVSECTGKIAKGLSST